MMQTRRTVPRRAPRSAPIIPPRAPAPRPRRAPVRAALSRLEHRALLPIALACLLLGLLYQLAGAFGDSVLAAHAGKAAMIFGFAGLRRVAGFGPEAVDASA